MKRWSPALIGAAFMTGAAAAAPPIEILDPDDAERYARIFALQDKGDWRRADREIKQLEDRLLIGHLLAQRYLHPTHYRSRYRELAGWMRHYGDHPQARRIYKLARKRKPRRARAPHRPRLGQAPDFAEYPWQREVSYTSPRRRSSAKRREVRRLLRKIRLLARADRLTLAAKTLEAPHSQRTLDPMERAIARGHIGRGWFFWGNAAKAYDFAAPAARRLGRHMPMASWIAGLAAYRLGRYEDAAGHFEALAKTGRASGWTLAAAGFWAARANMVARRPDRVTPWLQLAAAHPRTFYGLLAARVLGDEKAFDWTVPELDDGHLEAIADHRAGRRGLALLQIGQRRLATLELRALTVLDSPEMGEALLALADAVRLPALSLKTAVMFEPGDGAAVVGALYPLPKWRPKEGFIVDRAVVYAFMRQESRFNTRAKSRAGARGLMQLMPATAGFVAQRRFRGRARNRLYDPELNISLGQRYLDHLINHEITRGDLLLVAAGYNGGPGNLAKWRRRAARRDYLDPLMFIESIPSRETRIFIERVLANLWIYRHRLGQPAPSLDALAAGETPFYKSLDRTTVAENVRN